MVASQKNQHRKYIRFIGAGFQIGAIIYVFFLMGEWLDGKYHSGKLYTNILTLVGVFLSIYIIVKEAIKLGKDE
ncbi:AtpZ/AtpI family protein [Neptunitalea lumnitzerae]|uniref:F0F1-ATPase subunit Ca2+/Mg2+ transporter n=1 Tax=Neptunitalea lumnitzerae TaxID=2965509 RepID=A0ABQ5MFM3_9FLAO|nr:hypothetical protein Y10_04840 [Neptunitalea sp. Y10]